MLTKEAIEFLGPELKVDSSRRLKVKLAAKSTLESAISKARQFLKIYGAPLGIHCVEFKVDSQYIIVANLKSQTELPFEEL